MSDTAMIVGRIFDETFVETADQFNRAIAVDLIARDIDGEFNHPTDAALSGLLISAENNAHQLPFEMIRMWPEVKQFIEAIDKKLG